MRVKIFGYETAELIPQRRVLVILSLILSIQTTIVLAAQQVPQKIITLSPHLAELVYSLGSGQQLIGVIEHSDYPAAVQDIPRIGSASGLDVERILSMKPDLVLAWQGGTRESDIRKLEGLGLKLVSINSASLQDIPESLKTLGEILSQQQRSSLLIDAYNKHLQTISGKYIDKRPHSIFIEISSQPLMGLTNHHPFATGLELCGLKNIFANMNKAAIVTDLESILSRDVELVLLRESGNSNEFRERENFYGVSADSTVSFASFDEDRAFRQTPRLLDAVDELCSAVYGLE